MKKDDAFVKEESNIALGLLPVVVIGSLLGYLLAGSSFSGPLGHLVSSLGVGLVWAYLYLQWVELIADHLALRADPVPRSLNVGDREAVLGHLNKLTGCRSVAARARHLLQSWSLGWHPRQVMGLASFQSAQARHRLYTGALFAVLVLAAVILRMGVSRWSWVGLLALGVTVLARQHVLLRIDRYLESHMLARLPATIPQTAMTAAELAGELGGAIDTAFKKYIPQPEQMASTLRPILEAAVQNSAAAVEKLQKSLGDSQTALADKWAKTVAGAHADLKRLQDALAAIPTEMKSGMGAGTEQFKAVLQAQMQNLEKGISSAPKQIAEAVSTGSGQLEAALKQHAEKVQAANQALQAQLDKVLSLAPEQIAKAVATGSGQFETALKQQAEKIQAASQALQEQLDRIVQLGRDIEKMLHVQQAIEGTLKTVAATEEFRQTLDTLRKHVETSDALLREAAKPRVIRLVESEGEG